MEKIKYEKPIFEFEEMRLTERVANKCWGEGWAWIDHDADKSTDPVEYWFNKDNTGCAGNMDQDRLDKLIGAFPDLKDKVKLEDVKVNTKDSEFINFPYGS